MGFHPVVGSVEREAVWDGGQPLVGASLPVVREG